MVWGYLTHPLALALYVVLAAVVIIDWRRRWPWFSRLGDLFVGYIQYDQGK